MDLDCLRATAMLGNKLQFHGKSAFQPTSFEPILFPLVYAGMLNTSGPYAKYCFDLLNTTDLRGKIVVCDMGLIPRTDKGTAVKSAGGVAMTLVNTDSYANTTFAEAHVLPATHVSYVDGLKIKEYLNSTTNPMATILFQGTVIGDDRAPVVAAFSSRGPNFASRGILKSDILGPGHNILAAWPTSVENITDTKNTFNILSGTSTSCPHLSGVAALVKSAHPDWSPAVIKSAVLTTADVINLAHNLIEDETFVPANIFATGLGHVNASRAYDPGLVYDIEQKDYIPYLCGLNYMDRKLQMYTRTVTNVGEAKSSYSVEIVVPPGIEVHVEPMTLEFSEMNQKLQYKVTFSRAMTSASSDKMVQGYLKWSSSKYSVRSPIAVILQ